MAIVDAGTAHCRQLRVGLIGEGIQLSRTPRMHMEEGAANGLDYQYALYDSGLMAGDPQIGDLLAAAEARGLAGVNVTHPFKQAVTYHLDGLSEAATALQAVNTVVFRDGRRFGHNTDYWGFAESFRRVLGASAKDRVVLLGAGGAGVAVAHALLDNGVAHLAIYDRNGVAAESLVDGLSAHHGPGRVSVVEDLETALLRADGVVNATPVGMAAHPGSPIPAELIRADLWVADIIYFPLETELLATARARGCRTMDGSGMAVFQAARAFELFTGLRPDPTRMRATFDAFIPPIAGSSGT